MYTMVYLLVVTLFSACYIEEARPPLDFETQNLHRKMGNDREEMLVGLGLPDEKPGVWGRLSLHAEQGPLAGCNAQVRGRLSLHA